MLKNGLDRILEKELASSERMIDLFCGGGSVSWFAAAQCAKPVMACDLQEFATILAGSVILRTRPISVEKVQRVWLDRIEPARTQLSGWQECYALDEEACKNESKYEVAEWHQLAQDICARKSLQENVVCGSYGGHYFSPTQALSLDAMLKVIPQRPADIRMLCLAATIITASRCAAAPGHTAQPFKATLTAAKFLRSSWIQDPVATARRVVHDLCPIYAKRRGKIAVSDANEIADTLSSRDLVFIDPPYSGVQYSRFYHVLETIARGHCGQVKGVGRYPPIEERPSSSYSKKGTSFQAMEELLSILANRGSKVVLTFPSGECSNGLSGDKVLDISTKYFHVSRKEIKSKFSTLGGNMKNREARQESSELVLVLTKV